MGFCSRLFSKLHGKSSSRYSPESSYTPSRKFEKAQSKRASARIERDRLRNKQQQLNTLPARHKSIRQKSIDELAAKRQKVQPKKSVNHGKRVEMKSVGGTISAVDRSLESHPQEKHKSPSRKAKARPEPIMFSDERKTPRDIQKLHKRTEARNGDDFIPHLIVRQQPPGCAAPPQRNLRRTLRK